MTALEQWTRDAVEALQRRIDDCDAQPDFLDVVHRAHALDPKVVPSSAIERADALAPVVALHPSEPTNGSDHAALDGLLADVRQAVERKIEAHGPPGPMPTAATADRRGWWWLAGAVAAAVVLWLASGPVLQMLETATEAGPDTREQAVRLHDEAGTTGAVEVVPPKPRTHRSAPPPEAPTDATEPPPEPSDVSDTDATPSPARRRSQRDRIAALTEQAQRAWADGDRARAERLFRTITQIGGRSAAAQMAYADLFTLAHQRHDVAAQRRWWRAYLRRFAHGRFADDAQAGLCRTAAAAERRACWTDYLADRPKGSFRGEARTTIERATKTP